MSAMSLHQIQICFGVKGKHFSLAFYHNSETEARKNVKFGRSKSKQAIMTSFEPLNPFMQMS